MKKQLLTLTVAALSLVTLTGCIESTDNTSSNKDNGVEAKKAQVKTQSDGLTAEQQNVKKRFELENQPEAIQYFYAFSPSDNTYFYATVQGEVTSSGKALHPTEVTSTDGQYVSSSFNGYKFDGQHTGQVMGEDGTYGQSAPYLCFFDPQGNYYQYYINSEVIMPLMKLN